MRYGADLADVLMALDQKRVIGGVTETNSVADGLNDLDRGPGFGDRSIAIDG